MTPPLGTFLSEVLGPRLAAALDSWTELERHCRRLQSELDSRAEALEMMAGYVGRLESGMGAKQAEVAKVGDYAEHLETEITRLRDYADHLESEVEASTGGEELAEYAARLESEIAAKDEALCELEDHVARVSRELETARDRMRSAEAEVLARHSELSDLADHASRLEELASARARVVDEAADYVRHLESVVDEMRERSASLEEELRTSAAEAVELNEELSRAVAELQRIRSTRIYRIGARFGFWGGSG